MPTHRWAAHFLLSTNSIAAGADAGTPSNPHGDLNLKLALMVEYGLDPMQALAAATRNAAENLAILDSVGMIEVGKIADLMMVRGDQYSYASSHT